MLSAQKYNINQFTLHFLISSALICKRKFRFTQNVQTYHVFFFLTLHSAVRFDRRQYKRVTSNAFMNPPGQSVNSFDSCQICILNRTKQTQLSEDDEKVAYFQNFLCTNLIRLDIEMQLKGSIEDRTCLSCSFAKFARLRLL